MKLKFFDTMFSQYSGLGSNTERMLKYVVMNQNDVYDSGDLTSLAQQVRTILKTPVSEIFDRIVARGALSNFAAINVSAKDTYIPELLTMPNITIDLLVVPSASRMLTSTPVLKDKILLNLTGITKDNRYNNELTVSNVDVLQNLIVRGQLVATYHDDKEWIDSNTNVMLYALKSYSMILSTSIARYYNLNLEDLQKVSTILALYMDCACGGTLERPLTMSRWDWCPPPVVRRSIADACEDYTQGGNFNLQSVCTAMSKLISSRMDKFNMDTLLSFCGKLGPDIITSRIALEYPPYWVYLLILALNGNKIPLNFLLSKDRALLREGGVFLNQLYATSALYRTR